MVDDLNNQLINKINMVDDLNNQLINKINMVDDLNNQLINTKETLLICEIDNKNKMKKVNDLLNNQLIIVFLSFFFLIIVNNGWVYQHLIAFL